MAALRARADEESCTPRHPARGPLQPLHGAGCGALKDGVASCHSCVLHRQQTGSIAAQRVGTLCEKCLDHLRLRLGGDKEHPAADGVERRLAVRVRRVRIGTVRQQQPDGRGTPAGRRIVQGRLPSHVGAGAVLEEQACHDVADVALAPRHADGAMQRPLAAAAPATAGDVDGLLDAACEQELERRRVLLIYGLVQDVVDAAGAAPSADQRPGKQRRRAPTKRCLDVLVDLPLLALH
mmetsp:Transcript_32830/g.102449  ORF Transcript_32830/g.102449 Transcript_32830/m.102449 type:complete len:237 (+) Transcript_32830:331-1041(+)